MRVDDAPLKDVLKGIISKLEKGQKGAHDELIASWEKVVGKDAFKHTKLVSLKGGRLVVNVSDSSRLYELTLKRREIIKAINRKRKKKKIKEIRFKIGEI